MILPLILYLLAGQQLVNDDTAAKDVVESMPPLAEKKLAGRRLMQMVVATDDAPVTVTKIVDTPDVPCEDQHPNCTMWGDLGWCRADVSTDLYKLANKLCVKTCSKCGPPDPNPWATADPNRENANSGGFGDGFGGMGGGGGQHFKPRPPGEAPAPEPVPEPSDAPAPGPTPSRRPIGTPIGTLEGSTGALAPAPAESSSSSVPIGAIIGGVVGGILLLLLLCLALFFWRKKRLAKMKRKPVLSKADLYKDTEENSKVVEITATTATASGIAVAATGPDAQISHSGEIQQKGLVQEDTDEWTEFAAAGSGDHLGANECVKAADDLSTEQQNVHAAGSEVQAKENGVKATEDSDAVQDVAADAGTDDVNPADGVEERGAEVAENALETEAAKGPIMGPAVPVTGAPAQSAGAIASAEAAVQYILGAAQIQPQPAAAQVPGVLPGAPVVPAPMYMMQPPPMMYGPPQMSHMGPPQGPLGPIMPPEELEKLKVQYAQAVQTLQAVQAGQQVDPAQLQQCAQSIQAYQQAYTMHVMRMQAAAAAAAAAGAQGGAVTVQR